MRCIRLSDLMVTDPPKASVLSLGNFDGVHLAHQSLIMRAKKHCDTDYPGAACSVFCFEEPSWRFLQKDPPLQLCSLEEKLRLFQASGAQYAFIADFLSLMQLSPEEFIDQILLEACHAVAVVCGFNYRFGKRGTGTPHMLQARLGGAASVLPEVKIEGETVSSSRIRALLKNGNPSMAARMLGHPYTFSAPVVHGKALGKKLGAPTINQFFPSHMLIPRNGVYVTSCTVNGKTYRGISNIGSRPTVEENAPVNCETYLFDFTGDLYDCTVTVSFLHFLRPERRFHSHEELTAQIQADIAEATAFVQKEVLP